MTLENHVYRPWRRGTANDPIVIDGETLQSIREWLAPLDRKLETLPIEEQQAFIDSCRREAVIKWPWWFPNCHVYVE
jgi:hypothetical protein